MAAIATGFAVLAIMLSWRALDSLVTRDFSPSSRASVSTPSSLASLAGIDLPGKTLDQAIGDMIFLNDVSIEAGPSPAIFIVSGSQSTKMLVRCEDATPGKSASSVVDIRGTIRRLPNARTLRKVWKLSKDQIDTFGQQHIYLSADYIREQNHAHSKASSSLGE